MFPPVFFPQAAGLMHTFNAHAATDITGFGILGHAQNLAKQQRNEVSFVIHNLPVLAKMAAVSKACGNMFGLMHGTCPETSGKFFYNAFSPQELSCGHEYKKINIKTCVEPICLLSLFVF